jgi:diamine N-acetyltransferase
MDRARVTLRPVTRANVRPICDLELGDDQRNLVGPAAYTVAEAHSEPGALLRAIYRDEEPVGIALVGMEGAVPFVVRFMVDVRHQGAGIGARAVELLAAELRAAGHSALETSFVPVEDGAGGFWRACGFTATGRFSDGEPVHVRAL